MTAAAGFQTALAVFCFGTPLQYVNGVYIQKCGVCGTNGGFLTFAAAGRLKISEWFWPIQSINLQDCTRNMPSET